MAKEKFLDNRIAPKQKQSGSFPWGFKAPSYDNRTSGSIPAGNDYGTGFKQPVGTFKCTSIDKGPIPQKVAVKNAQELIYERDVAG